mmetsp:Transcript_35899/g.101663  ORF Transcript_35899/g.101663 Transcript_35899/m.101663 type:complete len:249 (-) Transcript_35899:115-861(-)
MVQLQQGPLPSSGRSSIMEVSLRLVSSGAIGWERSISPLAMASWALLTACKHTAEELRSKAKSTGGKARYEELAVPHPPDHHHHHTLAIDHEDCNSGWSKSDDHAAENRTARVCIRQFRLGGHAGPTGISHKASAARTRDALTWPDSEAELGDVRGRNSATAAPEPRKRKMGGRNNQKAFKTSIIEVPCSSSWIAAEERRLRGSVMVLVIGGRRAEDRLRSPRRSGPGGRQSRPMPAPGAELQRRRFS